MRRSTRSARADSATCETRRPSARNERPRRSRSGGLTCEYRLVAAAHQGRWLAHAERDTGDRFGIECAGASETEAIDRLASWLEWQNRHTTALQALQQAQREYHRLLVELKPQRDLAHAGRLNDALARLETARVRLDDIRARKPE